MSFQARALYDFSGEPNTAEMNIVTGEILTITRADVGDGWWEGINAYGKTGLFPEAYVERLGSTQTSTTPQEPAKAQNEEWDDEWDEDTYSEIAPNENNAEPLYSNEMNDNYPYPGAEIEASMGDSKGTVSKKTLNRFTAFAKNGGESYLLGNIKVHVPDDARLRIVKLDENTFAWPSLSSSYNVQVTSPKKESKLKGLKSFIAYQLTPSFNNIQVSRRYKHFDWLHERLTEKYSLLAIPPLPDKQISGRYEEQFIEHRRSQLQEFVEYVCRHPVLSRSEVWNHFLTCTDEKLWKQGKRMAEKDELIGANLCLCIETPDKTLLPSVYENLELMKVPFVNTLDVGIKNMLVVAADQSKKYKTLYSKENAKIGSQLFALGSALEGDTNKAVPCRLAQIIKHLGTAYTDIGYLYDQQSTRDWDRFGDKLYLHKGLTMSFQNMFSICRGAQNKRKEFEKSLSGQSINEIKTRSDVFTYATMAELQHFRNERDNDLKLALKRFVEEQIQFHENIVGKLRAALSAFND